MERLVETDTDFKRELLASIGQNNMIKSRYDLNTTVLENMKNAMLARVIMNLATRLRPLDFK